MNMTKTTLIIEHVLLLTDELAKLVVPEVEALGVCGGEALYGGSPAQCHAHQLVCDPQRRREVHIELSTGILVTVVSSRYYTVLFCLKQRALSKLFSRIFLIFS